MKKPRGFRLRRKLVKIFKWIVRPRRKPRFFNQLDPPIKESNPISKFFAFALSLRRGARTICSSKPGYIPVGQDPIESETVKTPKGHLAVYVGESEYESHSYLVPVIYFNHPLFGRLLEEAEKVNGFNHPGRITIPCETSEFEKVKKSIAASEHVRRSRWTCRRR